MQFAIAMAVLVAGLYGWVNNIVLLINENGMAMGMIIARAIGILVAPLGAVLGYI